MQVIVMPDVEAIAITSLRNAFTGTHVSTKVPDERPARFIKVTQVGGNKPWISADSVMLTFQCWEADTVEASELARYARGYIHALAGTKVNDTWIYKVTDVGLPAYSPDPRTDEPRYQFTVMVTVKGVVLT